MNLNIGKFCLFFCCIVPIILPASSHNLEKLSDLNSPKATPTCTPNSKISTPEKNSRAQPSSQQIRNLSDIAAKSIIATALDNRSEFQSISNLSVHRPQKRKRLSNSTLSETEINQIFAGYTPGKNKKNETFSENSSVSAEIIKASFKKDPTLLTVSELIENFTNKRLEKESKLEASLNDCSKKINEIKNGRVLIKALSVATPLMTAYVLTKADPQSRFGIVAATSVLSALPTIAGALGTLFIMWKIDKALHYGADILRADMIKFRAIDKKEVAKQIQEMNKIIQQEVADRIQGDQDVRKQNLTSLASEVKNLETKFSTMSHHLELAQLDLDHARNDLLTMAPEVNKAVKNSNELKGFLATQIFPTLQSIQGQVAIMRQREESQSYTNPLADNIEYNLENKTVEHKSQTPSVATQKANGIQSKPSKSPVPLISAESLFGKNTSAFQDQFRHKKTDPSSIQTTDQAAKKYNPAVTAAKGLNIARYFWGNNGAKVTENKN
jgi:hypothetical protein